jgi:hypothetical protein
VTNGTAFLGRQKKTSYATDTYSSSLYPGDQTKKKFHADAQTVNQDSERTLLAGA